MRIEPWEQLETKKPKGMKKKHEASYMAEETNQEIMPKKGKKK